MPLLLLSLLLLSQWAFAQPSYQLLQEHSVEASYVQIDPLQQYYIVGPDNALIKYSAEGDSLALYQENSLGPIRQVDATDPFQVLVYYEDYNALVLLDRNLGEMQRLYLGDWGLFQVPAFCKGAEESLWLYDPDQQRLLHYSNAGELLHESVPLSQLSSAENLRISQLLFFQNEVYAVAPEKGVFVFDQFGTFYKKLPLNGVQSLQRLKNTLFYWDGATLKSYHLKSFEQNTWPLPALQEPVKQVYIGPSRLLIRQAQTLQWYKF